MGLLVVLDYFFIIDNILFENYFDSLSGFSGEDEFFVSVDEFDYYFLIV